MPAETATKVEDIPYPGNIRSIPERADFSSRFLPKVASGLYFPVGESISNPHFTKLKSA
jgi:hypothetical protein